MLSDALDEAVAAQSIAEMVQEFCSAFELDVQAAESGEEYCTKGPQVIASIPIAGDWNGSLYLNCTNDLAQLFASKMFEMEQGDVSDDDVRDSLGELVNVFAGQYKERLPGTNVLGLPSITQGTDFQMTWPSAREEGHWLLRCAGQLFMLTVLHGASTTARSRPAIVAAE